MQVKGSTIHKPQIVSVQFLTRRRSTDIQVFEMLCKLHFSLAYICCCLDGHSSATGFVMYRINNMCCVFDADKSFFFRSFMIMQRSSGRMRVCGPAGKGPMNISSSTVHSSKSPWLMSTHIHISLGFETHASIFLSLVFYLTFIYTYSEQNHVNAGVFGCFHIWFMPVLTFLR